MVFMAWLRPEEEGDVFTIRTEQLSAQGKNKCKAISLFQSDPNNIVQLLNLNKLVSDPN
jgi:hypothetical protein